MRAKIISSLLITVLAISALTVPTTKVEAASSVTTADMIAMMNNWRTGIYGYPALVENAALDACAQATADTMASIQATTHLVYLGYDGATKRCATYGFGSGKTIFVTENWAMDTNMTIDKLGSYWSDSAHMLPASSAQYLYVGAGISSANGETYYVLQAGAISGETVASSSNTGSSSGTTGSNATADTSQYMNPVITSTPNYDGYIYHTVQHGQTLFDIALAYEVSLDYLKQENGLTSDNIYEGNTLKIKQAPTPTITPTFTPTPDYPTRTPTLETLAQTPTPLPTLTPTPVPSLFQQLPPFNRQTFGFFLVILSILGLGTVVYFNFFRKAPPPKPIPAVKVEEEPVSKAAASPRKKTAKDSTVKPASEQEVKTAQEKQTTLKKVSKKKTDHE